LAVCLEGGERREVPTVAEPSFPIRWSSDGKAVLIAELGNPARIVRIAVATGARVVVKELRPADPHAFAWFFAAITPTKRRTPTSTCAQRPSSTSWRA